MFKPSRGLRQGDPLSPSLFITITEVLTRLLKKEEKANVLHGVRIACAAPPISHFLFADDIMFFCMANGTKVEKLKNFLHTFAGWSGQTINCNKLYLHFSRNMTRETRDNIANLMRLQHGQQGGNYFGLPLCMLRSKREACRELQKKVSSRMAGCKAMTSSQAGRTVLIQTVASTLSSY